MWIEVNSQDQTPMLINTDHIYHAFPYEKDPEVTVVKFISGTVSIIDVEFADFASMMIDGLQLQEQSDAQ